MRPVLQSVLNTSKFCRIEADQRRVTLVRIRDIYIPELVIRLHALLANTGDKLERFVPLDIKLFLTKDNHHSNFKHALELANIVADSRYRLYDNFLSGGNERLGDYLSAVRSSLLKGLDGGGADPFWVLGAARS